MKNYILDIFMILLAGWTIYDILNENSGIEDNREFSENDY